MTADPSPLKVTVNGLKSLSLCAWLQAIDAMPSDIISLSPSAYVYAASTMGSQFSHLYLGRRPRRLSVPGRSSDRAVYADRTGLVRG